MKRQKEMIYYIIETLFLLTTFCFMLVMKNTYSNISGYDFSMFMFFALLVVGILSVIGPKLNRIIGLIMLSLYALYLVAQSVYFRAFGQYFRFSTALGLKNEVAGVGSEIKELLKFEDFIPFISIFVIVFIFIVLSLTLQRGIKNNKVIKSLGLLMIVLSFVLLFITVNKIDKTKESYTRFDIYKSDYYIYDAIPSTNQFVDKFGLNTLLFRDAQLTIGKERDVDIQKIDDYFLNNEYNHKKNDMTGIFKGKSLLIIQAESLMNVAISEEFTPNMYYYMNNGIVVNNFNAPLLVGSTSDTEFMANTSIIPMADGYPVCYKYVNNTYPLSLGNLFKEKGYSTYGYHNNYAEYYNRDVTFDKYGYEFFDSSRLGLENLEPDTKLAETIGWILSEKENFMGYWVSYSGHQTYELTSVGVDEEDVAKIKIKYPGLDDNYVAYIAKAMDLDKALGNFINVMDWSGRLNDFVIVVYGDHMAKGVDFSKGSNYDQITGMNSTDNPEMLYTPLFIYSVECQHKTIDKVSTSLDIMPTIANMWELDIDYTKVFGKDIFDDSYSGLYFDQTGNYKTNHFEYNVIDDTINCFDDYSIDEAKEEINGFNLVKEICADILKVNYFNKNDE